LHIGRARLFLQGVPAALPFKLRFLKAWVKHGFRSKTIIFYPQRPSSLHVAWKLCHILGYRMTTNPAAKAVAAIHFRDRTTKAVDSRLAALGRSRRVINIGCTDVSKSRVEQAFVTTFGYSSHIDPRIYNGRYVKKGETNALHNGEILDGPHEPEAGVVYQRFIESELRDGWYVEYRVPVFDNNIPFIMLKWRPLNDPFQRFALAEAIEKSTVITPEDETKLLAVCREMGLDYAELDVKRDAKDGKLYVLDINDTPSGIHPRWGKYHYFTSLHHMAAGFKAMVENEDNSTQETAGRPGSPAPSRSP
jgi:hypothetical protein